MKINIQCMVGQQPRKKSIFTSIGELNIEVEKISDMTDKLTMYASKFYTKNKTLIKRKPYNFLTIRATLENKDTEIILSKYDLTHDIFCITEKCILIFKCLIRNYCHEINNFSLSKELDNSFEFEKAINELKFGL